MKLDKFGMVLSDTSRSRAYLQLLILNNSLPSSIILLKPKDHKNKLGDFSKYSDNDIYEHVNNFKFNPEISVEEILKSSKISFTVVKAKSVNEEKVISILKDLNEKFIIYSGFGGIILRNEVLSIGKKFIHVHGGYLPNYKGSTCNYYSIIEKNYIGAASIIMNEKIDGGPVLLSKKFKAPKNKLLIDHYYDPLIRGIVLIETINMMINQNFKSNININNSGDMYFVIHPVLKHISILK